MITLHELPKLKGYVSKKRREGRGIGSSKGKTGGHGIKGQRVRNRLDLHRLQIFKQFPVLRGRGSRKWKWRTRPETVTLGSLYKVADAKVITKGVLAEAGLISSEDVDVKVLANGVAPKKMALDSAIALTKNAAKKIKEAGGTVHTA